LCLFKKDPLQLILFFKVHITVLDSPRCVSLFSFAPIRGHDDDTKSENELSKSK
jgi:hypothetical protein